MMKIKSFFKKTIILVLVFNLALLKPVLVLAAPTPPSPPEAPSAPIPPPPPPEPPSAPEPPSPPSPPDEDSVSNSDSETESVLQNEAINSQTGADSTNEASVENETNIDVQNENNGEVINEVNSQTMTGGNTASYNTGGGQITTGDAIQSLEVVTNLNQNTTLYSPDGLSINQANNLLTGSGSQNNSEITNKLNEVTHNNNSGSLTNKILLNSVSGQNFSSYNTGAGSVKTGNAVANLSLISAVNTNVTGTGGMKTFNIYDTHQGDLIFSMNDFKDGIQFNVGNPEGSYQNASNTVAENAVTGADSENNSAINNKESQTISNTNQGVLKNEIIINAISGENNTVKNTGEGNVEAGNATAVGTILNFLNTNLNVEEWMIGVVNIFGELVGDIVLPKNENNSPLTQTQQIAANSLTGAKSDNDSQANKQSSYVFENFNNTEALNNIETAAVTGTNTASYNTGPGKVQDGDATVNVQETTLANNNAVGDEETFWLVLVNKMGEWIGNIVGAESGETIAGNLILTNEVPEFTDGNQEKLEQAANLATGADSENKANLSEEKNVQIKNENQAVIENNIKIVAQSGKNSGSYNTLGGDIDAGDATVGLSLVNFVNNNLVGKKLIVLVVDVLGKWVGDIIPPDQEKESGNEEQQVGGAVTNNDVSEANEQQNNGQDEAPVLTNEGFSVGFGNEYDQGLSEAQSTNQDSLLAENYSSSGFRNGDYRGGGFVYAPISDLRSNQQRRFDFIRGLFISPVFAKETAFKGEAQDVEITTDWLYVLLPSLFGVMATRKKMRTFLASFL